MAGMQLFLTPTSPFARAVLVTALECRVAGLHLCWTDPWRSPADLLQANPFCTVPTLVTGQGEALWDSSVICGYLLGLQAPSAPLRSAADDVARLRRQATARMLMEVAVKKVVLERHRGRTDQAAELLIGRATNAIARALRRLEPGPPVPAAGVRADMADLMLAVALEYVRFRHGALYDAEANAALAPWLESWSARPTLVLTTPAALAARPAYDNLFDMAAS
jgi:glutathione S-transferase